MWRVVGREPAGERAGPGEHEAEDVAEVVAGIGEQRERIGTPAVERLDDDEGDVDRDADRERAVEVGRRRGCVAGPRPWPACAWPWRMRMASCVVAVVAVCRGDGHGDSAAARQPPRRARIASITAR